MATAEVEQAQEVGPVEEVAEAQAAAENGNQEQDPEARYRYDESLLLKGKSGKPRRPTKPDESERNLAVDKLKAEIEKRSARIKEIKETVEAARSARSAGQSGNQEIVNRLKSLRNEFQTVLRQKQHIREELNQTLKARDELRGSLRSSRDRLRELPPSAKGVTADTLDAKIAELEYKMVHDPAGQDEKTLSRDISRLQAARPLFREMGGLEANLKACEDRRADIQTRLDQCQAVLTEIKAREDAERAVLEQARSKISEVEPDIPALNVEKKECWDIIQALRAKIDEIRKDYNEKYQEYIKLDKNYNAYMRSVKRQEYLERQKARAERDAAENGAEGEGGAAPADTPAAEAYAAEVFTLDQLLVYLRKLVPADDKAVAQEEKKELEVPKGMKLLKKNDDDSFMTVSKKAKNQPKKGGAAALISTAEPAAASAPVKAAEPAKKKLNHGLDALKTFMQFGIEVPQNTSELPATIEKAEAKKAYYLELRRTGKKHEEPAPPRKASTPAAAAGEVASTPAAQEEPTPAEAAAAASQSSKVPNGTLAAAVALEPAGPQEPEVTAAPASKAVADGGVGVDLAVDEVTGAVSVKLQLA